MNQQMRSSNNPLLAQSKNGYTLAKPQISNTGGSIQPFQSGLTSSKGSKSILPSSKKGNEKGGGSGDMIDFSKPEKLIREIQEFLIQRTIVNQDLQKPLKTLSGNTAQHLIYHLINIIAPNYTTPPKFEPSEIQQLFTTLRYPYQIRNDSITAVGAPSTVSFLIRAIYWLFHISKFYFIEKSKIQEDDELKEIDEENSQLQSIQNKQKNQLSQDQSDEQSQFFQEILQQAWELKSYPDPHQLSFSVPNQIIFKVHPLKDLIIHLYQESLFRQDENEEYVFDFIQKMIEDRVSEYQMEIQDKDEKIDKINKEIETNQWELPDIEQQRNLNQSLNQKIEQTQEQIKKIDKDEISRKERIEQLRIKIERERQEVEKIKQENQITMGKVKEQPITKYEADCIINEKKMLDQQIDLAENKIRSTDENIRLAEKDINNTINDISTLSDQVNHQLLLLKLQNKDRKSSKSTPGKYSQGINIFMNKQGFLDDNLSMENDVFPILDELKLKMKQKLSELQSEKDKISTELVNKDLLKRKLESQRKSLIDHLFQQQEEGQLSLVCQQLIKDCDRESEIKKQLESENEQLQRQITEKKIQLETLDREYKQLIEKGKQTQKEYDQLYKNIQAIVRETISETIEYKIQTENMCEALTNELREYRKSLSQLFEN